MLQHKKVPKFVWNFFKLSQRKWKREKNVVSTCLKFYFSWKGLKGGCGREGNGGKEKNWGYKYMPKMRVKHGDYAIVPLSKGKLIFLKRLSLVSFLWKGDSSNSI